jgi:hypothetical protein
MWNQIKLFACDSWFGSGDEWCKDIRELIADMEQDVEKENKKEDENKPAVTCDKTEADFKTWALANVSTDNVTFNQTSCMGSVKNTAGDVIATYTWDGTAWK